MKTIMIYALLTLLGLNFQSCGGKNKKDKNMANSYAWGPAASAPILFPVESRNASFNTDGKMSVIAKQELSMSGLQDMQIEASGKMLIASQKKMNIQSVDTVDIAKG